MIAHIKRNNNKNYIQDLKMHLEHTALLCKIYMGRIGCPSTGYLVGILHDAGKACTSFQFRMQQIIENGQDPGKSAGHASAGAIIFEKLAGDPSGTIEKLTIQIICEAIFSHHSALPDNVSPKGEDGYQMRMEFDDTAELINIEKYLYADIISKQKLQELIKQSHNEITNIFQNMIKMKVDEKELYFFCGLLQKMLLSSLIDADWLDSLLCDRGEEYFRDYVSGEEDYCQDRNDIFKNLSDIFESNLNNKNFKDTSLNYWRKNISYQCKEAANRMGGIYTLRCPTGAGKTLASLRFALSHCEINKKDKIYYILPFLSILDQNAKSIKHMICNENNSEQAEQYVLELHSNVEPEKMQNNQVGNTADNEEEELSFFAQRMDEPIVLTTLVRFLNTFFAKGTRNLRPAHQFQNAVIIFDEIQSLPIKQIALFNSLINFLAYVCNCTCVLCTATQPLLGELQPPVYPARFNNPDGLVTLPKEAYEIFRRVRVEECLKAGGYCLEETVTFLIEKAKTNENVLMIMNTRKAALEVYQNVIRKVGDRYQIYYLSTKLYAAHRKLVIEEIRDTLRAGKKLVVVSTQLIEAGLDFDFSCVIRSIAGFDSITQAAGRCNREGISGIKTTYIINPDSKVENLTHLKDISEGVRCSYRVLLEYKKNPGRFDNDLLSEKVINQFFQYYFWARRTEMTYTIKGVTDYSLYDLLADNSNLRKYGIQHCGYRDKVLNQSFRTAAEKFYVINDRGNSIFVLREEGKIIWEKIQRSHDYKEIRKCLKRAQQYIVNISDQELQDLGSQKGIVFWDVKMSLYILNEMYYDSKVGVTKEINQSMPLYEF